MKKLILILGLLVPAIGFAQQYTIDWHKIAGGGGTSTGSVYSVSGTIGQSDASGAMSGGKLFFDRRILEPYLRRADGGLANAHRDA
jgi:hypothetical protein